MRENKKKFKEFTNNSTKHTYPCDKENKYTKLTFK